MGEIAGTVVFLEDIKQMHSAVQAKPRARNLALFEIQRLCKVAPDNDF